MIIMIRDGLEGIKSLTSIIGKTVIKLVWIFFELDLSADSLSHEKQI